MGESTVLVVDDEPAIRLLCRVNLELDGHRVLEAGTLDEGRRTLAQGPQLVLLDLHVAGEDGLDLLTEIRADYPEIKVVLLTGTTEITDEHRQLADGVLTKPFTLEQLGSTVSRLASV
jgi:two-component system nitrogen regulation response regulator NtrX